MSSDRACGFGVNTLVKGLGITVTGDAGISDHHFSALCHTHKTVSSSSSLLRRFGWAALVKSMVGTDRREQVRDKGMTARTAKCAMDGDVLKPNYHHQGRLGQSSADRARQGLNESRG